MVQVDYDASIRSFVIVTPFMMSGVAKSMPTRKWNKKRKCWLAPPVRANVEYIKTNISAMSNVQVTPDAAEKIAEVLNATQRCEIEAIPDWYKPKLEPRAYQKKCADQFYGRDFGGLFMCCGSGKTKVTIDLICARYMAADKVLDTLIVACPLSVTHNWLAELDKHCTVEYCAAILDRKTKGSRDKLHTMARAKDVLRVLIVGIESMSSGRAAEDVSLFMDSGKCAFVLDEMSKIKTPTSNRTKAITKVGRKAVFRLGLTGTPVTQGLQDLYSQLDFLSPDIIGYGDYYSFRNRYMVMGGFNDKQIIGYNNVEELLRSIAPHVFQITLDEALPELPDRTYADRTVPMMAEQKRAMKEIDVEKVLRTGDTELDVKNALEQMLRMQQVAGGFIPTQHVDPLTQDIVTTCVEIPCSKINEVVAIADENSTASIIYWARFRPEIKRIADALRKAFGNSSVVEFHGGIEQEQRWKNIEIFESKQARFFVGNQSSGGIGINLIAASIVVYYSNTFSLEDRIQSEARNFRMGQKNAVTYIDLMCEGTVDEKVKEALSNKESVADYVTRALQ